MSLEANINGLPIVYCWERIVALRGIVEVLLVACAITRNWYVKPLAALKMIIRDPQFLLEPAWVLNDSNGHTGFDVPFHVTVDWRLNISKTPSLTISR